MKIKKFKKRPIVIEAVQLVSGSQDFIVDWIKDYGCVCLCDGYMSPTLEIATLEGTMRATCGDWIIKGVNNEFYPCKSDIFEKTYELASDEA